jgi:hypothetical protein
MLKTQSSATGSANPRLIDTPTVVSLSALAYIIAVFLHEIMGHGLACVLLGSHNTELGAFYADCAYAGMSDLGIRLVALAGPAVSVLVGVVSFMIWRSLSQAAAHGRYLTWLLGTIGLLQATGYLLFSGIIGLGDFGTSRDGALYQLAPEWVWRVGITVLGVFGYGLVIYLSLKAMDRMIGGEGAERVRRAQRLALTSYLTGAVVSVLIGLLNPHGLYLVLVSAAASSLGGTSALAWMMRMLNRQRATIQPPLRLGRSWAWMIAGAVVTFAYTLVLGPTLRP